VSAHGFRRHPRLAHAALLVRGGARSQAFAAQPEK
jgi:hypothetical protein